PRRCPPMAQRPTTSPTIGFWFADHNADRLLLAIPRVVAKIKNPRRQPKPFGPIIDGPDVVGIGQYIHEPSDEIIDTTLIFRGRSCCCVSRLLPALQFPMVHEIALAQLTVGCRRAVDQVQDFHGAYSLRSTSGVPIPA